MKKKLLAVALVAAMAMGLMACGGSSSGSSGGGEAAAPAAEAPAASGEGIRLLNGKPEIDTQLKELAAKYQEETGHLYNYEATPAESTCYRFALGDKKRYPDIITQRSGKDCYYTNSCHIPVCSTKRTKI